MSLGFVVADNHFSLKGWFLCNAYSTKEKIIFDEITALKWVINIFMKKMAPNIYRAETQAHDCAFTLANAMKLRDAPR